MNAHATLSATRPLAIIVPRSEPTLYQSLRRTFDDDATVRVTRDRRLGDRRVGSDSQAPERRRGDRRCRSEMDAQLKTGRWVVVPPVPEPVDLLDPDARAILFLCCSQHSVPCQACQTTYRIGWIPRAAAGVFRCPLCAIDLGLAVAAHAQACRHWAHRRRRVLEVVPPG